MLNKIEVFTEDTPIAKVGLYKSDGTAAASTPVSATYIIKEVGGSEVFSGTAQITDNTVWHELTTTQTASSGNYVIIFKVETTSAHYESFEILVEIKSR